MREVPARASTIDVADEKMDYSSERAVGDTGQRHKDADAGAQGRGDGGREAGI